MKLTPTQLEEVIKALFEKFPDKLPEDLKDIDEMNFLIGQQSVIRYLLGLHESLEGKQNANK